MPISTGASGNLWSALDIMNTILPNASYVIEIEGLTKEFALSHAGYGGMKSRVMASLRRENWTNGKRGIERRLVLDDLNLRISHGETVGLIGRNGSGKSTLLGLLSRIYRPTAGRIQVHGRVAPLLELGAGFHAELTGIENIYFNAAILGLSQTQIAERFDSIVAFAELEASIDAPVRNYSSGMLLRLGFSIAAHVDADVLLIDEALAVGDEAFQNKCFAKIAEFQRAGKTIVVVSHEMDHVERVATRLVWLQNGRILMDGDVSTVLAAYLGAMPLSEP
jgi:lipopolysaccharide transport system ATP-binding protein